MGDPTPRDASGDARTMRGIFSRLRNLEQARPLQNAFNDASAAQTTADGAQEQAGTALTAADVAQGTAAGAQATASGALGVAQGASHDASVAQTQAAAAQQAAAAKTKTTWSTVAPDSAQNPGTADGDTWYVTNGTGGNTTAQWRWNASASSWTLTPIDGAAIRNIVADSITSGTFTGLTFRSAGSGQRAEIVSNQINFYSDKNALAGNLRGVNFPWANVNYPVIGAGGGGYGVLLGGGIPIWSGTTVGLQVNGDTAVKRVFLDPAAGSDGYVCGIYGFAKKSSSDATPVPMPLLYAKGNTGSAYPDMFIENIKAVTAENYLLPDGTSISADTGWVTTGFTTQSGVTVNGPQIRRVGNVVSVLLNQILIDSIGIPSTGDVANRVVIKVPPGFAPSVLQPLSSAASGAMASYYINAAGNITLAATVPDATQTGTVTKTNWETSAGGTYLVG